MKSASRIIVFLLSVGIFLYGMLSAQPSFAYYSCGNGPCNGSYPCNAGLSCNGAQRCGVYYNTCSGATCTTDGGWDQSTCSTGDQCTPGGSTATANWGSCSPSCGPGLSTCTAGVTNGCTASCSSPAGAIGNQIACCTDQAPQNTPSAVTCTQSGITRNAQVNWTFPNGTGCSQPFGYKCSAQDNRFELRFNGGKTTETEASGVTPYSHVTGLFPDWGTYTVQVCALNGAAETCSPTTNCVLTPPQCTTSGQDVTNANPNDACIGNDPNLNASWGNNANLIQFLVHNSSSTTLDPAGPYNNPPYPATSGWYGSSPSSYTPSLATGTYYWNVHSQSNNSPVDCITPAVMPTGMQLNIDKTAPATPLGDFTGWAPDPACSTNYFMTYGWNPVSDTGCAGLDLQPYHSQISLNNTYTPVAYDSGWISALSYTTAASYPARSTIYGRVQARDAVANTTGWSLDAGTAFVIPSPSPYPTLKLVGTYVEDLGYSAPSCVPGGMSIVPANFNLNLNIQPNVGVTPVCDTISDPTGFTCYITFDNINSTCVPANHTISISGSSYGGYEGVEWRESNTCNGLVEPNIPVDASRGNVTPTPINTYFKYGPQTWFKTSNISLNNRVARNNIIPNNTVKFDGTNDDTVVPPNNKYLIVASGGAVLEGIGNAIDLGGNASAGYSANNWFNVGYTTATNLTPSKFADYMRSRKQYKTVTSTGQITGDGMYYVAGDITLDSGAAFDNKKVVLVVEQGTVTINTASHTFMPINGNVAIVANTIAVDSAMTEVDAILIGNTINIGNAVNYLKVVGNLIQLSSSPAFTNTRISPDGRKPSFFLKLDQAAYLNLLQYLSVSVYDWRQIQ